MLTFDFHFKGSSIDLAKMLRQLFRRAVEEGRYGLPKEHAGRVWYISAAPHEKWADDTGTIERIIYPAYSHSLWYDRILAEHRDPWPELERRGMLPLGPEHRRDEAGIVFALRFQEEGKPLSVTVTVNPVFAEEFDLLREELRPVLQVPQRVLTLGDLYKPESMLQSILQALRSPVLDAMQSIPSQAGVFQAAMLQAALAADAMQSLRRPSRPPAPTIIARREPSLRAGLAELESLPEDQQLDYIHAVYQALPPSVQAEFLRAAAVQYAQRHTSTTASGIVVVEHHHHHYHAPQGQLSGGAAPVSEMSPNPERQTPEGDELLSETPPRPGENGATWDDVFDWYYRMGRGVCPSLKKLAGLIGWAEGTVYNNHNRYKAQYGEKPMNK